MKMKSPYSFNNGEYCYKYLKLDEGLSNEQILCHFISLNTKLHFPSGQLVKDLLKTEKFDLNYVDEYGFTPLDLVMRPTYYHRQVELEHGRDLSFPIRLLLFYGAKLTYEAKILLSQQLCAKIWHKKSGREIVELINYGADINYIDLYGKTPLTLSIKNDYFCVTDMLLKKGADSQIFIAQLNNKISSKQLNISAINKQSYFKESILNGCFEIAKALIQEDLKIQKQKEDIKKDTKEAIKEDTKEDIKEDIKKDTYAKKLSFDFIKSSSYHSFAILETLCISHLEKMKFIWPFSLTLFEKYKPIVKSSEMTQLLEKHPEYFLLPGAYFIDVVLNDKIKFIECFNNIPNFKSQLNTALECTLLHPFNGKIKEILKEFEVVSKGECFHMDEAVEVCAPIEMLGNDISLENAI